ncbi:MAG: 50S ribosomal protein L6 [Clostridia bacterium]|nr:50S ribosomal protein L6 [Clostridia bacterium]
MSRIGNLPIDLPDKVQASIDKNIITIKGPKGEIRQEFHRDMQIDIDDKQIVIKRPAEDKMHKAIHGLTRSLINNMVLGVTNGFERVLEINGVGYRAQKQGKKLVLNVGYSHPVEFEETDEIQFDVPQNNKIIVKGIDKQKVGAVAATIRGVRPPEPYKGKGIKYQEERIRRKEGKAAK